MRRLAIGLLLAVGASAVWIVGSQDGRDSQGTVRVTGIYSDMYFSDASGDLRGTEVIVFYSSYGYYVTAQGGAGPVGCPVMVPAVVNELTIEFVLPSPPCMIGLPAGLRFLGVVTADGLRGHYEGYPDSEMFLPRGPSYWQ